MIVNCFNGEKEHPGVQPIRVLRHNIAHGFQNYHPDIIKDYEILRQKGFLTNNIIYNINDLPIFFEKNNQLPFIQNGTINIHEIFLTYLWCICFSIHTPLYEIVHKKNDFENNKTLFNECNELMKFAYKIKTQYDVLDKEKRFNPELFEKKNESYIGNTNGVFINALNFILCHEYAHAKHQLYNGTKKDEYQADFEATKLLVTGSKDSNDLGNKAVGGLIGLGSLLLLSKSVNSSTHPDNDRRLYYFIENLKINDNNSEIWALGCLIFAYWDKEYEIKLDFEFNDLTISYKDRFKKLLEQ
jgi:hypothetical protein